MYCIDLVCFTLYCFQIRQTCSDNISSVLLGMITTMEAESATVSAAPPAASPTASTSTAASRNASSSGNCACHCHDKQAASRDAASVAEAEEETRTRCAREACQLGEGARWR